MTNNLKTVGLLGFLGALVWLIAIGVLGQSVGLWVGLILAGGIN
ncbi:MAG TPA: protease HtpX, partial [Actinobacteria bacterium]|nr:protease HtpX [Actinomycetota bacterium]